MHEPPTILDDRGVARPLYAFPRLGDGVPPGCPLTAREQAEAERALGVPWRLRTPSPPTLSDRIPIVVVTLPLLAIAGAYRPERLLVCVVPLALLVLERIMPARLVRPGGRTAYVAACVLTLAVLLMPWAEGGRVVWPEFAHVYAWVGLPVFFLLAKIESVRDGLGDPRRNPTVVRRVMLRAGRCPSCAEIIDGVSPAPDGRRACPRCGAAWILHALVARRERTCDGCGYSLEGLRVAADGSMRCPECGRRMQVGPRPIRYAFVCWGCGRPLVGLELVNGDRVKCPDCGTWRSGLTAADVRRAGEAP
ncbi:MAG: hypothetical protein KIS87_14490 [Phycisphaeraceae bacterium]|nr:hypothetical protein [Phycisphaeraceae bacterium]